MVRFTTFGLRVQDLEEDDFNLPDIEGLDFTLKSISCIQKENSKGESGFSLPQMIHSSTNNQEQESDLAKLYKNISAYTLK